MAAANQRRPPRLQSYALAVILLLAALLHSACAQTWEASNDPDSLCLSGATKHTGYRPTRDCRGYVYCNDGYLMGGGAAGDESPSGVSGGTGVIACWPNQLFDVKSGVCTYWQQVDTSGCPDYDGSMMMPEVTDGNANPERFFCGASASNARRVCEACPGGSRLECSDPTHNCFAGVTGCPAGNARPSANAQQQQVVPVIPPRVPLPANTQQQSVLPAKNKPAASVPQQSVPVQPPRLPPTPTQHWMDENANPERFFCGASASNAKRVCEACPSGSSAECSDPSHNCFAGITGCSTGNGTPNNSQQGVPVPPRVPVPATIPQQSVPVVSSPANKPSVNAVSNANTIITVNLPANNNNNLPGINDVGNDDFLHGKLRSSYYCGWSWEMTIKSCPASQPCPTGLSSDCPTGQTCFPDTPCHSLRTPPPVPKPTPKPIGEQERKNYCGWDWEWVLGNCNVAIPCPYGVAEGVCPDGMKCLIDTPCFHHNNGFPTPKPSPFPTKPPTNPPVQLDDPAKRFCGHDWDDVTENCLTAVPCPGGFAEGVCPYGMKCMAETPCRDVEYLAWLTENQAKFGSGQAAADKHTSPIGAPSNQYVAVDLKPPPKTENEGSVSHEVKPGVTLCTNNYGCEAGQFCHQQNPGEAGICGECLPNGTGCSTEEICRTDACNNQQASGVSKCFSREELNQDCEVRLNDLGATCNVEMMVCERWGVPPSPPPTPTVDATPSQPTPAAAATTSSNGKCSSNNDCGMGKFCDQGHCGECLPSNGAGCAAEEYCSSTASCHNDHVPRAAKCHKRADLDSDCEMRLNEMGATCNVQTMVCESAKQTTTPDAAAAAEPVAETSGGMAGTAPAAYENPDGNYFFCGESYAALSNTCLQSKPCPGGFASDHCADHEGCFSAPHCKVAHESAKSAASIPPPAPATPGPTKQPTNPPTPSPSSQPTPNPSATVDPPPTPTTTTSTTMEATTAASTPSVGDSSGVDVNPAPSDVDVSSTANADGETTLWEVIESHPATDDGDVSSTEGTDVETQPDEPLEAPNEPQVVETTGTDVVETMPDEPLVAPDEPVVPSEPAGTDVAETMPDEPLVVPYEPQVPSEPCNLCGNAQIDWSQSVTFEGHGEISCGEFGWIFASKSVFEGSDQCLNSRARYFDDCCYAKSVGSGCNLCDSGPHGAWHDIQKNVDVEYDGDTISCADLSDKVRTRFEPSSEQCSDVMNQHFSDCCFEKCSLCGDSNLDWDASVKCHELDSSIFVEQGIGADSSRCEMSQSFYSTACCIEAPENPCLLCRSHAGAHFDMLGEALVSYDGERKTCLEVYHSLYSRREQSSTHCLDAQHLLAGSCCDAFEHEDSSLGVEQPAIPVGAPTTPEFDTWYAGTLTSPASRVGASSWLLLLIVPVGLLFVR
ncbi:hypothetical protein ACHAXT_005709 [Thalassiosira profunda]